MFSWRLRNRLEARHHGSEQHIRCPRFQQFRGHHSGCWNLVMRVSRTRPTRFFRAELVMGFGCCQSQGCHRTLVSARARDETPRRTADSFGG